MADANKRKDGPSANDRDNRGGKRSKGGSSGKWQTPHQKAKAGQPRGGGKIEPGDVGIWVTCQKGKEGKATEELKRIFSHFTEQFYGIVADSGSRVDAEEEDSEDIEAAIRKEVAEIGTKDFDARLITPVFLDLQCVLFFKTKPPIEPVDFVQRICEEAVKNPAGKKTRFANRLTPMTAMGKATEKGVEDVGKAVLAKYFKLSGIDTEVSILAGKEFSYAIRPTIRNHSTLKRDVVIKLVASLVAPRHKVDLTSPDKVIIVEIYQNICGMSVVNGKEWENLKRFNLAEIYQPSLKPGVPKADEAADNPKSEATAVPDR